MNYTNRSTVKQILQELKKVSESHVLLESKQWALC